jgi:hypothetical protein
VRCTFVAVNIIWSQIPDALLRHVLCPGRGGYSLPLLFMSRVSVDAELCAVMYLVCVFTLRFFSNLEEGALSVSSGVMPSWGIRNVSADVDLS